MLAHTDETRPQEAGFVVRAAKGGRVMQSLTWGFPLSLPHRTTGRPMHPKPVNLIADLTNSMWSELVQVPRYRCLIPISCFGEPDGVKGWMTRTWFSVRDRPVVAWAGFCRNSELWGPVFAGMTTDSNEAVAPLNPRMPVLLDPEDHERWLHGSIEDVIHLQFRPFPAERLARKQTDELWVKRERGRLRRAALA